MIVLEISTDVRGFSFFTLPPKSGHEFWDLYKNCFHQRVLEGSLRICLYRPKPPPAPKLKNNNKHRRNQH
ncbi:unnamed protein product [Brassica napus]|uniref:(rape) hypothetical protein n=1 Tax=Brassica napus TaxID=3708 RepID=A0A816VQ38_BRANA|nr:unnamed protein product [Brassica napus]